MTNKKLIEKLKEDMEMRRFLEPHKRKLFKKSKRNSKLLWKTNEPSDNQRIKRIFNEALKRRKESK